MLLLRRASQSCPGSWRVSQQQEKAKLQRLTSVKLAWLRRGRAEVRKLASAPSLPSLACLNTGDAANPTQTSLEVMFHLVLATSCAFLQLHLMHLSNKTNTIATTNNNNNKKINHNGES